MTGGRLIRLGLKSEALEFHGGGPLVCRCEDDIEGNRRPSNAMVNRNVTSNGKETDRPKLLSD